MPGITFATNQITSPVWAHDPLDGENVRPGAQLDPTQFFKTDAVLVTVDTAGAAGNATSVPVLALPGPIPAGTLLDFGAKKFARVNTLAAAGATSLVVDAIPTALVSGDVATYAGAATSKKTVYAGTPVGRTFTERTSGTAYGPAINTDDEVYLVAFDRYDLDADPTVTLVRTHVMIYENFLPGWTGMLANLKAKIRATYQTITGVA